jgi:hypothetical protein
MSEEAAAAVVEENASPNGDTPDGPAPEAERSEAEQRSSSDLFKFSTYVHIGPGAAECEDRENGSCGNPLHFHAWCRLPNQFQHASIREKALAAKARKLRQLRDEESDARIILDESIAEMVRRDDREAMIAEAAAKHFADHYQEALQEVADREEFQTIQEDRERLRVLSLQPEEDRPKEEYEELDKHLTAYGEAIEQAFNERQEPLKASLAERSTEELGELLKEERIDQQAQSAFQAAYGQWEAYIGTLKPKPKDKPGMPSERVFKDINQMVAAAPEVIETLDETFQALDAEFGRALKNS